MQRIEGQLLLSPTDLTKHLACAHVTTLDLLALDGRGRGSLGATAPDDALQLVFRKGTEHESAYLQRLRSTGLSVAEIPTRFDLEGRRQAEAETLAAMREGVDVVYQGTFFDGRGAGRPTSCCASTSRATSAAGPTTSPTPSWPAGSRCRAAADGDVRRAADRAPGCPAASCSPW